jgi:hypothetical protein
MTAEIRPEAEIDRMDRHVATLTDRRDPITS